MGSTVRLRLPSYWAFFLVSKTCVFSFLASFLSTQGLLSIGCAAPCAKVSSSCFVTLHLGFSVSICVWPGESRSDPLFTA